MPPDRRTIGWSSWNRQPQPAIAFNQQNWGHSLNSTTYGFAWALMAGLSYQITPSVAIDLGYRYLNGGPTRRWSIRGPEPR